MKECDILGVKAYSDPSYIFSGKSTLPTRPGSTRQSVKEVMVLPLCLPVCQLNSKRITQKVVEEFYDIFEGCMDVSISTNHSIIGVDPDQEPYPEFLTEFYYSAMREL